MTIHSQHIAGALAFWETHRKRIVDAVGSNVVKYIDDFTSIPTDDTTGDPTAWTMTVVEAGTGDTLVSSGNAGNGTLLITTAGNEDDQANLQLKGESFKFEADKPMYFGARIQGISDVDQTDLFIGLAITDTDILGGVAERIGFESLDATAALSFVLEEATTQTTVAAIGTLADDTAVILEFYWDGAAIEVFVDGVSVSVPAITNLPNAEELRVSIQFQNGEAAANTCHVDWIRCIKFGRQ
jgi:hypothetical protein